jgi:hypothetical protein
MKNHAKKSVTNITQQDFYNFSYKDSCRVATTANITLSGTQTIDVVDVVANDRVLVKNQTDASENGIYFCASGSWSRTNDCNSSSEAVNGSYVAVSEGTSNGNTAYVLSTNATPTVIDTTELTFTNVSAVPDESVTLAKLEHAAANTVLVRDANSSGDPSFKALATTEILIGNGSGFTVAALSGDVTMTNAGAVTVTDLPLKANLADPTFTGVPAAPTAAAGTDTTQVATTAFVNTASVSVYSGVTGDATISSSGVMSINPHRSIVATNIALHDQGTDTSCHVVFSSDTAPLEDDITVNKATYANNSITRAIYDEGVNDGAGYKSQVLFPVAPAGYARIDFRRTAGFILYAGLVLNTENPVANDTATGYSELYALNFKNDNNVRLYHDDGIQAGGINITTWSSDDLFSIVYDGGHGSSTSGTVVYMKNNVDLGHTQTGLASDLIFHAKFEDYLLSGNDATLLTVDKISFSAAPTVHTSENLIYNSSTGELAATSFTGTSLKHNSLVIGGASQNNTIDFGTDDIILFDIDNTEVFRVDAAGVDVTGAITATGDITAYSSDNRLKTNIEIINDPLDKINKLSGFTYDWARDKCIIAGFDANDEKQIGVFAQDVQSVIPEAVKLAPFDRDDNGNSKSGDNYLTVQYEKIVPLLIESIKEQQKQIEALRNEVGLLKK